MRLYRVFPFDSAASTTEPGGALFAPHGRAGRIANPDLYHELYCSTSATGAVSEAFGRLDVWTAETFVRYERPYALAELEFDHAVRICELDNVGRLLSYELVPSDVVASDRAVTRGWAARIYKTRKWVGISWWSRYDSRWHSAALWQRRGLRVVKPPQPLSVEHPAVLKAAALLPRRLTG